MTRGRARSVRDDISALAAAAGLFVLLSRSRGTEAVAAAAAAAAAAAGGARRQAGPVSAAAQQARRTGPGLAQASRTACGGVRPSVSECLVKNVMGSLACLRRAALGQD